MSAVAQSVVAGGELAKRIPKLADSDDHTRAVALKGVGLDS